MGNCVKCNADLAGAKLREGVSKKTGNPWKAYVCPSCEEFNFIRSGAKTTGYTPTSNATSSAVSPDQFKLLSEVVGRLDKSLNKKLDEILTKVKVIEASLAVGAVADEFGGKVVDPDEIKWEE